MGIQIKARPITVMFDPSRPIEGYTMTAETYSQLDEEKVLKEAAVRSGIAEGVLKACWNAAGEVVKAWATDGHTVAVPGLGSVRYSINAKAVDKVEDVSSDLVKSRKLIFTPNVRIKQALKNASINITCYDKDGKIIKRVLSADNGDIEEGEDSTDPIL